MTSTTELKRSTKNKRQISKNMEIGGEKMRKSGQQGENERQCRKEVNRNMTKHWWAHTTFSNIKWVRKFHIVVVQNNVKEMYKIVWCGRVRLLMLLFLLGHIATGVKVLHQTTNQKRHITKKVNSHCLKFHRTYSISFDVLNVDKILRGWIRKDRIWV